MGASRGTTVPRLLTRIGRSHSEVNRRLFGKMVSDSLSVKTCANAFTLRAELVSARRIGSASPQELCVIRMVRLALSTKTQIDVSVSRIVLKIESQMASSGGWLGDTNPLLAEIRGMRVQDGVGFRHTIAAKSANLEGSAAPPTPKPNPSATEAAADLGGCNRSKLLAHSCAASESTISYDNAAVIFEVSSKTIRNWLDDGKLDKGVKRSRVTVESVLRRLKGA